MLEVIRDVDRLQQIGKAWGQLAVYNPVPMLSHDWTVASAMAFSAQADLAVFALWQGDRLRAVAPMGVFREGLSRRLHLISYPLREPGALLFEDAESLKALLNAMAGENLALSFARLTAGGVEEALLRDHTNGALTVLAGMGKTHTAILPSDFASLEAGMSTSAKTTLRRKLRKAEKVGTVCFTSETPVPSACVSVVDEFVRVEESGWKGRNGTALASVPEQRTFYEIFARLASENGALRVNRMLIDGKTVAMAIDVVSAGRLYELKIAYDEDYRDCSPGLLLTHQTLKAAIAEGIGHHEFLGTAEDWQRHWPLEVREHVSARRYPLSSSGTLNLSRDVYCKVKDRIVAATRRWAGAGMALVFAWVENWSSAIVLLGAV